MTFFGFRGLLPAALITVGLATTAQAQSVGWDGQWSGRTGMGRPISLTISGSRVASFTLAGVPVLVTGTERTRDGLTIRTGDGATELTLQRVSTTSATFTSQVLPGMESTLGVINTTLSRERR